MIKLYRYEDYCEKVDQIYQQLKTELSQLLPKARIEHIGSSSVPGSLSKGDLDVFVAVPQDELESALKLLCTIGFTEKLGTFSSHELCMLVTDKFNHDVAIQLVANHSQFEDFLRFKRSLSSNNDLVERYNQIKISAQGLSLLYEKLAGDLFLNHIDEFCTSGNFIHSITKRDGCFRRETVVSFSGPGKFLEIGRLK